MTATYVSVDDAKSTARALLARTLASALITGIDQAAQEHHELTQLQQIDMATMTIMAYRDGMADFDTMFEVGAKIQSLRETKPNES